MATKTLLEKVKEASEKRKEEALLREEALTNADLKHKFMESDSEEMVKNTKTVASVYLPVISTGPVSKGERFSVRLNDFEFWFIAGEENSITKDQEIYKYFKEYPLEIVQRAQSYCGFKPEDLNQMVRATKPLVENAVGVDINDPKVEDEVEPDAKK